MRGLAVLNPDPPYPHPCRMNDTIPPLKARISRGILPLLAALTVMHSGHSFLCFFLFRRYSAVAPDNSAYSFLTCESH